MGRFKLVLLLQPVVLGRKEKISLGPENIRDLSGLTKLQVTEPGFKSSLIRHTASKANYCLEPPNFIQIFLPSTRR